MLSFYRHPLRHGMRGCGCHTFLGMRGHGCHTILSLYYLPTHRMNGLYPTNRSNYPTNRSNELNGRILSTSMNDQCQIEKMEVYHMVLYRLSLRVGDKQTRTIEIHHRINHRLSSPLTDSTIKTNNRQ